MVRTAICFVSTSVFVLVALLPLGSLNAAGTAEQQEACFEDAMKFCGSEIPDVQRITACMVKNIRKLSPRCRAQFGQPGVVRSRFEPAHPVHGNTDVETTRVEGYGSID